MFEMNGKVAVVTGASSGLGEDAARAYAAQGCKVALLARRKDKLEAIAEDLKKQGVEVVYATCDVTDEDQVKAAIDVVIKAFGRIDILLNNAGIAVHGGVHTLSVEDWNKSMDINVKGIFLVSKYVIPHMIEQKYGKVVNVSSINAFIGDKADIFIRHGYNTSKAAVLGLSMGMAASYGKHNITVNTVNPGLFESEMTQDTLFKSQAFLDSYNSNCPLCRPGKRGELNGTILYFSSDASSYVTGQYVIVDGGTSLV